MRMTYLGAAVLVGLILANACFFQLDEGQQALITQFGEIKGAPISKAGLHFKLPLVQDVRRFDKRILSWDGDPEQIPSKDKKYIWVDTTARWRIKDLRKFAETVQNEQGARERLDAVLDGTTRDTISSHNLVEAVRNTNSIFERVTSRTSPSLPSAKEEPAAPDADKPKVVPVIDEDEISVDLERVATGREQLSKIIIERTRRDLEPLGIELIDVQLRRIAYEKSVEDKVYDRMISERKRVAERLRSIGKGEEAKVRGKLNRDLKQIESDAYRRSQEIRGTAEAKAIAIYAASLRTDPDYYELTRKLATYRESLGPKAELIFSTDSDFFKLLKQKP